MISAKATLLRLGIHDTSIVGAVRDVGMMIREHASPLSRANALISALSGKESASYTDVDLAVTVAQSLAESAVRFDTFDPDAAIGDGEIRHKALTVRQPWLFARAEAQTCSGESVAIIDGIEAKVVIVQSSDGTTRIKKGGKQLLTAELYKKHVLESPTPVDNQGFIAILIKELHVTKSCATTYSYNANKQFGGRIVTKK